MTEPSAWDQAMAGSIFSAQKEPPVTAAPPDEDVEKIREIMAEHHEDPQPQPRSLATLPPANLTLAAKLATILGDPALNDLEPAEWNKNQGYYYWSIGQVCNLVRGFFGRAGIVFVPSITSFDMRERTTRKGDTSWLTTVLVDFTLINEDDPTDRLFGTGIGQGDDPGDKGANKAFTGAVKTWLKYLFLIGEKDDAEADDDTDIRWSDGDDYDGDRRGRDVVDRTRSRQLPDDRHRDDDVVRIEPSNIEGIERGGRSSNATEAQVTKVRDITREANISLAGLSDIIKRRFEVQLSLGADAATARNVIIDFLSRLSADDIGGLITELDDIAAHATQGGALDDPGYSGYDG